MPTKTIRSTGKPWPDDTDLDHLKRCYNKFLDGTMSLKTLLDHYPGRSLNAIRKKLENDGVSLDRGSRHHKPIPGQCEFPMGEIE